MNYANMIEEKTLKKTFIIAYLISTIIGTFTAGMGLVERIDSKRKDRAQKRRDEGQDKRLETQAEKIKELEKELEDSHISKRRSDPRRDEVDLRRSLRDSGPLIRREYDRDFDRLGQRFAQGDTITQNQLQGQIIHLQSTVINLLEDALYTGRISDVNKLYNATEFARHGTISALRQQYQRMLQEAPVRRHLGRPGRLVRRISSSPSVRALPPSGPGYYDGPPPEFYRPPQRVGTDVASRHAETVLVGAGPPPVPSSYGPPPSGHGSTVAGTVVRERGGGTTVVASTAFPDSPTDSGVVDSGGPLFCRYGASLQNNPREELCSNFARGGDGVCPSCGVFVAVEEGRAWRVVKEMVRERISTPEYDEEIIEERVFLIGNRFVVKCHREAGCGGFACVLCYRNRERDTILGSVDGLVKHVWRKHEVEELEREEDIRQIGVEMQEYERVH